MMDKPILFSSRSGEHRWLSNMEHDPFYDADGVEWPTVEHYYQAAKATLTRDRHRIRMAGSAFEAKRMGSRVASIRSDWGTYRLTAMREALAMRFRPGSASADRLLATGDRELVHDTPWGRTGDPFWGNGRDGHGRNMLGVMMMEQRKALKAAAATAA